MPAPAARAAVAPSEGRELARKSGGGVGAGAGVGKGVGGGVVHITIVARPNCAPALCRGVLSAALLTYGADTMKAWRNAKKVWRKEQEKLAVNKMTWCNTETR